MSVNARNLENLSIVTPKGHPRVCWVVFVILRLQHTAIDNARINTIYTIDTIDGIDCIDQYEYN